TPTYAGDAFATSARELLVAFSAALDRTEATAAGRRGRVVLGSVRAATTKGFTSAVVDAVRREHPEITLHFQDSDPPDVWEQVSDSVTDVAISWDLAGDPSLIGELLWEESNDLALLPVGHPLARKPMLTLDDLATLPGIVAPQAFPPKLFEVF